MINMIEAVIFDIDGVLLDSREANIKWYQLLLKTSGYSVPSRKQVEGIFHLPMMDAIRVLANESSEEKVRKVWEMGRGRKVRYPIELLKIPEHAGDVVHRLGKTYRLAIVTSRVRLGVEEFFRVSGLKKYFEVVVAYEDYTHAKPDPEPLLMAVERLGIKAEEAVYIGDTATDIEAASAAGMKIILYAHTSLEGADFRVSSFREIPGAVEKLNHEE